MILSGTLITPRHIKPFRASDRQPASYDVHLNQIVRRYTSTVLDLGDPRTLVTEDIDLGESGRILHPGNLLLGSTVEEIDCGDYAVQIVALSSLMRIGLQVGQGSWADPGFHGHLTLEMSPMSGHPIKIYSGMRIAQLVFHTVDGDIEYYKGRYQGQQTAMGAMSGI